MLSFLLALKLRTDTANSTSPGIPSATTTALRRSCSTNQAGSHGARRAAGPGSPLAASSSAPLLHNLCSLLFSSLTKWGFK